MLIQAVKRLGWSLAAAWWMGMACGCGGGGGTPLQMSERACIALAACGLPTGTVGLANCVAENSGDGSSAALPRSVIACAAAAGPSCDAARACLGQERLPLGSCDMCVDNRMIYCGITEATATDCGFGGAGNVCTADGSGARCSHAECDPTMYTTACENGQVATCSSGRKVLTTCPTGTACGELPTGGAGCIGTGDACTEAVCEGDVIVHCDGGRLGSRIDCGAVGASCVAGSSSYCEPRNMDCMPFSGRCDGGVLEYCSFGRTLARFDCVAHGYLGCDGSGTPRCIPPSG